MISFFLNQSIIADGFRKELIDKNESIKTLNQKGIELARKGHYERALKKFQYLEYIDNISAILYNNLGYTYQLKGDSPNAIKNYKKSIKIKPKMIFPRQNLGKLLFESGKYKNAIVHGEYVLSIDPKNSEVMKWLPTAYKRYKELVNHNNSATNKEKQKKIFNPYDILLNLAWETLKIDYYVKNIFTLQDDLSYYSQPIGLQLPMTFKLDVRTYFQLKFKLESLAFTGILNPMIVPSEETIEIGYWFEKMYVGFGIMLTQMNLANPSVPFGTGSIRTIENITSASDFKFGLSFDYTSHTYDLTASIFPRYLFRDSSSGSHGISVDRNFISIDSVLKTNWDWGSWRPRFLVDFVVNEWYITEYQPVAKVPIQGHYFGYYDLGFGMSVKELSSKKKWCTLEFGFKITNRFYFLDLNDTNPFAFGNGQGFLGLNTSGEGKTISGFREYTAIISLFSKQFIHSYFIIEESIAYTYVNSKLSVFDINLKFSFHI